MDDLEKIISVQWVMSSAGEISYREYNKREKIPVVLIHGAGGSYISWPVEIRRLEGCHIYALDLPGHGNNVAGGYPSIPELATTVLNWLQVVGLKNAAIAGHSLGSAVALYLAYNHPDCVDSLVLLGSSAHLRVNPGLLEMAKNEETFNQAVDLIIRWSFSESTETRLVELVMKRMLESRADVLYTDLIACNAFDFGNYAARITQPTLVLCGSEDKMTPPSQSKWMAERIPAAWLEVIPKAGHMLMLENPQAVAKTMQRFLMFTC